MSTLHWMSLTRRVSFLSAALLAASFASAQSSPSPSLSNSDTASPGESSSNTFLVASYDGLDRASAFSAAASSAAGGGGQERGWRHTWAGNFAAELGAGFNAPIGNDTPYITWGANFDGGAGIHFSKRFSLLGEFQFLDDKLPGPFVAAGGGQGGNAHIVSLTADPVIDLFPKRANGMYLTGGGGYYHKSTNFTVQECCDFYGYPVTVTANSFTSNQGGVNLGLGISHRMGGTYGDGTMRFFAEARYTYIHTPAITANNGLGTTELIPVNFGLRW